MRKTTILEKENNEKIQHVEVQLTYLEDATAENIKTEEEALKKIFEDIKDNDFQLQSRQKKEISLQKLKELFEQLEQQKQTLADLQNIEKYYQALELKIKK